MLQTQLLVATEPALRLTGCRVMLSKRPTIQCPRQAPTPFMKQPCLLEPQFGSTYQRRGWSLPLPGRVNSSRICDNSWDHILTRWSLARQIKELPVSALSFNMRPIWWSRPGGIRAALWDEPGCRMHFLLAFRYRIFSRTLP